MKDFFIEFIAPIVFAAILIVGLCLGIQAIDVYFVDNVPIEVQVDGKEVYKGISAGYAVKSSGMATTVIIKGGFLYFFPKAVYTSQDVKIIGKK
jgi:hypothetical protein